MWPRVLTFSTPDFSKDEEGEGVTMLQLVVTDPEIVRIYMYACRALMFLGFLCFVAIASPEIDSMLPAMQACGQTLLLKLAG